MKTAEHRRSGPLVASVDKQSAERGSHDRFCVVIHPFQPGKGGSQRQPQARLEEAQGLAESIGLRVCLSRVVTLRKVRPATLLGAGVIEEIAAACAGSNPFGATAELVVIDGTLSPIQQRNLEKALDCKVIDRTGLILEIFGERAQTKEGRLQVELAALVYARSRLVRSWTHLERQRGGLGFVGGPGETQIEADRRLIDERIIRLRRDLDDVVRTRGLHRKARAKLPTPVVALVGYTNAGKSTLFNRLTKADVYAEDQLFATLDPTMRALTLPSSQPAILSDTVGFVSDLPHELVAAFRATLEEVREADIILHVRDIAHEDTDAQEADVREVLETLDVSLDMVGSVLHVLNKIDLLSDVHRQAMTERAAHDPQMVALSAATGTGCDDLLTAIDELLWARTEAQEVAVPITDGALLSWIYRHGDVTDREDEETEVRLTVRLDAANSARLARLLANNS